MNQLKLEKHSGRKISILLIIKLLIILVSVLGCAKNKTYKEKDESDREYFKEYLSNVKKYIPEVYLIEYGANSNLIKEIENYCNENGFYWYNAKDLELK